MKKICLLLIMPFYFATLMAQSIGINTDASNADSSAILDIKSSSKGVLIPRLTKAQRDAVVNPANGLMIFQTDNTPGIYTFNTAGGWALMNDNLGNHQAAKDINLNGFHLFNNNPKTSLTLGQNGNLSLRTLVEGGGISPINVEKFRIDSAGSFFIRSDLGIGSIPIEGKGYRMMWHAFKAAFRAGAADSTCWNDNNMGFFSWAGGNETIATGVFSFAFGDASLATGTSSVAMGSNNTAAGGASTAMGFKARALGLGSVALGYGVSATGQHSVAIGHTATNNNFKGTMAMGDASTNDSVRNSADNQFVSRYAGGYKLFSNSTTSIGVQLTPGGSSWSFLSDSTKKENFTQANAELFLHKLRGLKLGSWNYKSQPAANYRHYGPMAQEIFSAYGKDEHGTIGCDTLLASADMDGIIMIMLQGLEKRSLNEQQQNKKLQDELKKTKSIVTKLAEENRSLTKKIAAIEQIQQTIVMNYMKQKDDVSNEFHLSGNKIQQKTTGTNSKKIKRSL
jgi:hypothetical protein